MLMMRPKPWQVGQAPSGMIEAEQGRRRLAVLEVARGAVQAVAEKAQRRWSADPGRLRDS